MSADNENIDDMKVKIESLRQKFLEDYKADTDSYDECDVQRVRDSEWTLKRFLLSHKLDEELSLKNLIEAMKWRKSFGVNTRTDDYFPEDFYKIGGIFQYNSDKDGNRLLYLRVCVHHKVNELSQFVKEYFVHNINKIDSSSDEQWVMVCDSSNSGLSNVDMDFSRFIVDVLQNYFPKGFKYVIIYNMPFLMYSFWKITQYWLSDQIKDLIKTVSGDEIFNYISAENVPQVIPGGKCATSIYAIPKGVKTAEELPHIKFTDEQLKHIRTIFNIQSESNSMITANDQ
jgi:hypothetical protein